MIFTQGFNNWCRDQDVLRFAPACMASPYIQILCSAHIHRECSGLHSSDAGILAGTCLTCRGCGFDFRSRQNLLLTIFMTSHFPRIGGILFDLNKIVLN